jgi:hypothetical protein
MFRDLNFIFVKLLVIVTINFKCVQRFKIFYFVVRSFLI